jgi:hypothetical protein
MRKTMDEYNQMADEETERLMIVSSIMGEFGHSLETIKLARQIADRTNLPADSEKILSRLR